MSETSTTQAPLNFDLKIEITPESDYTVPNPAFPHTVVKKTFEASLSAIATITPGQNVSGLPSFVYVYEWIDLKTSERRTTETPDPIDTFPNLWASEFELRVTASYIENSQEMGVDVGIVQFQIFDPKLFNLVIDTNTQTTLQNLKPRHVNQGQQNKVVVNSCCEPCLYSRPKYDCNDKQNSTAPSTSMKTTLTNSTSAKISTRDLVIDGEVVIEYPQTTTTPPVIISNVLHCHDETFTFALTRLRRGQRRFPSRLTVQNISCGLYYTFVIVQNDVVPMPNVPAPNGMYTVPANFPAGTYIVTFTDATDSSQTYRFTVTAPNLTGITAKSNVCKVCNGAKADVTLTGTLNNKELWCNNSKFYYRISTNEHSVIWSPTGEILKCSAECAQWFEFDPMIQTSLTLPAGCYTIDAVQTCGPLCEDNRSCEVTTSVTICEYPPIRGFICNRKVLLDCHGDEDGYVEIWGDGGVQPYKYTVQKFDCITQTYSIDIVVEQPDPKVTGLGVGRYRAMIVDSVGCSGVVDHFEVRQPCPIKAGIVLTPDRCGITSSARAYVTGGSPFGLCNITNSHPCNNTVQNGCNNCSSGCEESCPVPTINAYMYSWININNPNVILSTNSFVDCLSDGSYQVTVRDSKCCSESFRFTVKNVPAPMKLKVIKHKCDQCTFTIDVCIECGVGPYTYYVDGTQVDDDISCYVFSTGKTFKLKVVDSKGKVAEIVF